MIVVGSGPLGHCDWRLQLGRIEPVLSSCAFNFLNHLSGRTAEISKKDERAGGAFSLARLQNLHMSVGIRLDISSYQSIIT